MNGSWATGSGRGAISVTFFGVRITPQEGRARAEIHQASPASCASSAICTRLLSSSLVSSRETCALTVATLM